VGAGYLHRDYGDLVGDIGSYTDPAFGPPPEPFELETAEGFASGTLVVPLQFELGAATFVAVGPRVRLQLGFEQGSQLLRFGITAGVGRYF
jgi:hypothetical protein